MLISLRYNNRALGVEWQKKSVHIWQYGSQVRIAQRRIETY